MATVTKNKCDRCAKTTVWICLFECLFIALFKVVIGLTGGSKAMLGSALYSLTDVVSAFLLIVSLRVSSRPPDAEHPYGYGKIEHVVSLLISLLVLLGTVAVLLVSTFSLFRMDLQPLHWIGLWASLACLCLSQIVYRLVICAGKQSNSPAMITHAKHVRLDSISTIAVIVAILAAEVGFRQLDSIIAILEAVHILFECSKMMHRSINRLMDASIDKEYVGRIHTIVSQDPNVRAVTDIKGKHSGRGISLDIEILLDGRQKIGDCNETVRALKKAVRRDVSGVESVHIHYHPCRSEETANITA
jgi:cation diffusion facilitator family transporter